MTALCLAAKKKMTKKKMTNSLHFLQKTCAVRAERSSVLMTDFDASWCGGVGAGADIPTFVIKEWGRSVFHAFQFRDDAFMKLWSSRDLSQHITSDPCHIAVTSSGQVLLKLLEEGPGDEKTVVLDDGRYVTTYTHGGQLIGCLPPGQPVYARKRERRVWKLVVVDVKSSTESTLQNTWGGYSSRCLSVCGDEDGRIAVTSYEDDTLCIYSSQGARQDIIYLTYRPGWSNAVCGNHEAIFICEYGSPASVHVHAWSGRHLQRITHDQLGIPVIDLIHAVRYNEQTHSLLLATTPSYSTDRYSLWSYKTKYEYAPEEMVFERRLYYGEMAEEDADQDAEGSSDEASVGSSDEDSVGSSDEASVGSSDEDSVGSSDQDAD